MAQGDGTKVPFEGAISKEEGVELSFFKSSGDPVSDAVYY